MLCFPFFSLALGSVEIEYNTQTKPVFLLTDDAEFTRGPTVNMVTNHSAMIFSKTNGPTNVTVRYWPDGGLGSEISNTTLDTVHRVVLNSLDIDTKYFYQVVVNGTESEEYHFRTAPPDGEPFKMLIFGDNRPSQDIAPDMPEEYIQLLDLMVLEEPHIVLHTGDFVHHVEANHENNLEAFRRFSVATDALGHYAPIYGIIGNHDTGEGWMNYYYYLQAFEQWGNGSTYFSFDYAGVHFSILNTELRPDVGKIVGDQWDWLVDDLTNSNAPMKFVFGHKPLYPLNHIGVSLDTDRELRNQLQALFEEHNVTMYGTGHDHLFNRMTVNKVLHVLSGGAGASPYQTEWGGAYFHYVNFNVSAHEVSLESIGLDGNPVETYSLPYDGPIEIFLREIENNSLQFAEAEPLILFSEAPVEFYYSWDGASNSTTLDTLSDIPGEHTLDVYAVGENGVWVHKTYVFTTRSETTPPPGPTLDIDPLMLAGLIGVVAVVVVIVVVLKRRS
jgi:hypothetical protein